VTDFVICARNIEGKKFGIDPAPSSYLAIEGDKQPQPISSQVLGRAAWATRVQDAARAVATNGVANVLVFVHGYNNDQKSVMSRHRRLRDDLIKAQFGGVVVSFDWPSGDVAAFYLRDLAVAHASALQLVSDGIMLLASLQRPDCNINVHILAHSMGAYVTREAFTAADDADELAGKTWHISQAMLIAGDISSRSLRQEDQRSDGLYRNCTRLTNYSNQHDDVLGLSNVKRAGVAPRAGRVGLPDSAPAHAVNVDCSAYWEGIFGAQDPNPEIEHSWYIGDPVFTADMIDTMNGIDRNVRPTRDTIALNRYVLKAPL
jgi:esterase/lipase superfamily enzyme